MCVNEHSCGTCADGETCINGLCQPSRCLVSSDCRNWNGSDNGARPGGVFCDKATFTCKLGCVTTGQCVNPTAVCAENKCQTGLCKAGSDYMCGAEFHCAMFDGERKAECLKSFPSGLKCDMSQPVGEYGHCAGL